VITKAFICFIFIFAQILLAQKNTTVLFHDDFANLNNWTNLIISAKKPRTDYQIIQEDHSNYLKIISNNSASGLLYVKKFHPREYPVVSWRWRVDSLIEDANGRIKSGDDYPVRIFILFAEDSSDYSFWHKLKNTAFKIVNGYELPHSGLIYVWSNSIQDVQFYENPYSEKLMIWVKQQGTDKTKNWISENVNILDDYLTAFGELPPNTATLAIMGDSDNTGTATLGFIDYIQIEK